jgi:transposase
MTGQARVLRADRSQPRWDLIDLEALVSADHRARVVWSFVGTLDLTPFYAAIGSREGEAGRPSADPQVLLALWLYATLEGVGSARQLDRLVEQDVAYRWLAGGVPVNYHGLSDFRVGWTAELDRLLTESVTALVCEGIVDLTEIAIDGTKVRAPVSSRSFTRGGRLDRIEQMARRRIEALKQEVESDPAGGQKRRRAAQERAAREAEAKVAKARATLERLRKEKEARAKRHGKVEAAKGAPSASLTDPEARRMRFADGAVRAGYNVQTAALPKSGLIVALSTTDRRNDTGLALPMAEEFARRYGCMPKRVLLDEGYAAQDDVVALAKHPLGPVVVYMPQPAERPEEDLNPESLRKRRHVRDNEPKALKDWRARMQTDDAKEILKRRKLIERIHAQYKNRALARLTIRGLIKTQAVALWHALANNLMTAQRLRLAIA